MATVVVQRTNTYINHFRNRSIYIDGKKAGSIANGQTWRYELTPGPHTIQAKVDWWGSREVAFTAGAGTTTTFLLDGFRNNKEIMILFLGLVLAHLFMEKVFQASFLNYILLPGLLFLAAFLVFGGNKYLTLDLVSQTEAGPG